MTDSEQIERYRQGSHEAFAELVRRHVDWVYGVAHRRVGDPHFAEDVTQATFMVLATKLPRLSQDQSLSSWLFGVVNLTCKQLLRQERRRLNRETRAAKMRSTIQASETDQWEDLAPRLDELVEKLRSTDRDAVLLRFYQQKTFAEVGIAMGISEEAARKRVGRAIEQLRSTLAGAGVSVPATALGGMLLAELGKPAPAALAASISEAVTTTSVLAKGVITMMAISKLKFVAASILAAVLVVGGGAAVLAQIGPQRTAAPATQQAVAPAGTWQERFDQVYRLEDNEVLRLIPPPFIPEREQYYHDLNANRGGAAAGAGRETPIPTFFNFEWRDKRLITRGYGSVNPARRLRMCLTGTLGFRNYQLDVPQSLMNLPMPGDWIVRADASDADKLQTIAGILSKMTGKLIQAESKLVERQVIVASGEPSPQADTAVIHFSDPEQNNGFGGGGGLISSANQGPIRGNIQAFLDAVATRGGVMVIDERQGSRVILSWDRSHTWTDLSMAPDGPDKDRILQSRLESLSAQTGLKFTLEKRNVAVWQLHEAL